MIPVHRPRLPSSKLILPYLDEIDAARWYSNSGPLLMRFEKRLANHFGTEPSMLTTAANGTLMMVSILRSFNIPDQSLCIMPSWTFVATPAAACYSGLIPYFVDVDRDTQTLQPAALKAQLSDTSKPIGAVIVVAPFGAPVDRKSWDEFTAETGIPVIIDAAAAFDTVRELPEISIGNTPVMISLHATKIFGIGEGGLVLSTDADLVKKIKLNTSFGFNGNREALLVGYNAKLSEYSAAVGLASLDDWENTRNSWAIVRDNYIENLDKINVEHHLSREWVSSTYNIILPEKAEIIAAELQASGIDTRKWWGNGCHQHAAYEKFPTAKDLSNTDWLAQSVLGLPGAVDFEPRLVKQVTDTLGSILENLEKSEITYRLKISGAMA